MLMYFSRFLSGDLAPFWPHVVLLSISVLSSIAVGVGIILERPKYSPAVHKVAFWLVVVGIGFEAVCTIFLFVFDEGISNSQQDKIIALEKRIAPRTLSPTQESEIADSLRGFSDVQFATQSYATDPEGQRFQGQIAETLVKAGFRPISNGHTGMSPDEPMLIGLKVLSNETGKPVAEALCSAFKANDFPCVLDDRGVSAGPSGRKTVAVWVGVKAIAEP